MSSTTWRTDHDTPKTSDAGDLPGYTGPRDTVPWPGQTFMIIERAHQRALTLIDGQLRLEDETSKLGCRHWICVEKNGWLGFRNAASGTYIGHDGRNKLRARALQHRDYEYLCVRRHPNGSYILLNFCSDKLFKVDFDENCNSLSLKEEGGIMWDFLEL